MSYMANLILVFVLVYSLVFLIQWGIMGSVLCGLNKLFFGSTDTDCSFKLAFACLAITKVVNTLFINS